MSRGFPDPKDDVPAPNAIRHKNYPWIRYVGAREPPRIIFSDPTVMQCIKHFESHELSLMALTTAFSSYTAYRHSGNSKPPMYPQT